MLWTTSCCSTGQRLCTVGTLAKQLRQSHKNSDIKQLYHKFLGEPNSERAHHLLHTHYKKREVMGTDSLSRPPWHGARKATG